MRALFLLLHFHQFDVEIQFLAGHFAVAVEGDGGFILCRHRYLHGLACVGVEHHLLAHLCLLCAGKLSQLHGEDGAGIGVAVGLIGGEVDVDGLAHGHLGNGLVVAADHHAHAADELQRLATVIGGVEHGAVVEGAAIVGLADLAHIGALDGGSGMTAAATTAAASATGVIVAATAAAAQNDNKDESANTNGFFRILQGDGSLLSPDVQGYTSFSYLV